MRERIKRNIKFIMGVVVGICCCSMAVYAAYQYVASEVSYSPADKNWNVNSVEEALNELHSQNKESGEAYGIVRELNTPTSSWARVGASIGLEANAQVGTTPIKNDFDTIYPWSDIISYNYDTDTKQITAYYGEENFTFTPTGNVEVLTRIPEFYYRRYQENGYEYIYISKEAKEGYIKSEEFSIGRYTMSGDATRVHSRSGVVPLADTSITDFRNYARNLGEEFGQLDYHYFLIQLLYLVEYADYNAQAKLGPGYTNSYHTGSIPSGGCDALGMHSGSADGTDNSSVIYRGIEDIFGNIWQYIDGINIKDYQAYVCYNQEEYAPEQFDGCYQPVGYISLYANGQWVSKLGYDASNPLIAFPTEANGTSTIHMTDYFWFANGSMVVLVGNRFDATAGAGFWSWNMNAKSSSFNYTSGARLLKTT